MELFDKKYLYVEWDDVLEGKDVLVSDCIPDLKMMLKGKVEFTRVVKSKSDYFPFFAPGTELHAAQTRRFCYYDPLLEYKVALKNSERVQARVDDTLPWLDITDDHEFDECLDYRVVEEEKVVEESKRLTKRQLSQWLAQGHGEIMCEGGDTMSVAFIYSLGDENEEVTGQFLVRKWTDDEWHEPTVEYCFGEGRCQEE